MQYIIFHKLDPLSEETPLACGSIPAFDHLPYWVVAFGRFGYTFNPKLFYVLFCYIFCSR